MTKDVLLTVALSDPTDDPVADLGRFQAAWRSLLTHNAALLPRVAVALVLVEGAEQRGYAATAEVRASMPAACACRLVAAATLGRAFNEALRVMRSEFSVVAHWLHWDDAHEATRPFWEGAVAVATRPGNADLWLLRLCDREDEEAWPPERRLLRDGHTVLLPHPDEEGKRSLDPAWYTSSEPYLSLWPSFTLEPALHSAAHLRGKGAHLAFAEGDDVTWPELQWRFGLAWEAAGGVLAALDPPAAAAT